MGATPDRFSLSEMAGLRGMPVFLMPKMNSVFIEDPTQGAIEQAEAGHAAADQVCMAPDVAIMFDELQAIADRRPGWLQADVARLTTEPDQARRRCTISETSRPYVGEPEPIPEVEALAAAEAMARSRRKGSARMFRLSWPAWSAR